MEINLRNDEKIAIILRRIWDAYNNYCLFDGGENSFFGDVYARNSFDGAKKPYTFDGETIWMHPTSKRITLVLSEDTLKFSLDENTFTISSGFEFKDEYVSDLSDFYNNKVIPMLIEQRRARIQSTFESIESMSGDIEAFESMKL